MELEHLQTLQNLKCQCVVQEFKPGARTTFRSKPPVHKPRNQSLSNVLVTQLALSTKPVSRLHLLSVRSMRCYLMFTKQIRFITEFNSVKRLQLYEVCVAHCSEYVSVCLLGCNAECICALIPTFRRCLMSPSSGQKLQAVCF